MRARELLGQKLRWLRFTHHWSQEELAHAAGVHRTYISSIEQAKRNVSLDDIAWALGIESSKTAAVEGSKVFDLYYAGKLAEIREYNLNDVRVTRKVYERMVACLGR